MLTSKQEPVSHIKHEPDPTLSKNLILTLQHETEDIAADLHLDILIEKRFRRRNIYVTSNQEPAIDVDTWSHDYVTVRCKSGHQQNNYGR